MVAGRAMLYVHAERLTRRGRGANDGQSGACLEGAVGGVASQLGVGSRGVVAMVGWGLGDAR